jgi:hypothetical protein
VCDGDPIMADRPFLAPNSVVTNGVMASNITSATTVLKNLTKASYSYSWSGASPVGTVAIQLSNDYSLNPNGTVNNSGTWTTAYVNYQGTQVASVPLTGNTGTGFIDLETGAYASRTVYTAASGSGALQVVFVGKVT